MKDSIRFSRVLTSLALASLLALGTGCWVSHSERGENTNLLARGEVGPEGGTLSVTSGPMTGATVTIPPGALASPLVVSLRSVEGFSRAGYLSVGQAVTLEPSGTAFLAPVTVLMPYDGSRIPSGYLHTSVKVLGQDAAGNPTVVYPADLQPSAQLVAAETTTGSTLEPAVRLSAPLLGGPSLGAAVPANRAFEPTPWPSTTPLLPPRNHPNNQNTFLWNGYNVDGSSKANAVQLDSPATVGGFSYTLRRLTTGDAISVNGQDYKVYSAVPEQATTTWAYQNPATYYTATDPNRRTAPINGGAPSTLGVSPVSCAYSTSEPAYLATGSEDSLHFLPNLPNGRSADGTYLDRLGLTENVAWTINPYVFTLYQPEAGVTQQFSRGWATPSTTAGEDVSWNKLKVDGKGNQMPDNPATGPLLLYSPTNKATANLLLETIDLKTFQPKVDELLTTLSLSYLNADSTVQRSPTWLKQGAFVSYQAMPGFQRNLIRNYTPTGAFTLAENTSDLFVRAGGGIEIPAVLQSVGGTSTAMQPYPLVAQTWVDQTFALLNHLPDAVPSTQDQYPGEEAYYLGNTFLPGKAGVITNWLHYPKMVAGIPDERDSDSWLGLAGDTPWDVMAWNTGEGTTFRNDLNWPELGAQVRKPYMFGASVQVKSDSDPATLWKLRLEHSNSFWWYQVAADDPSLGKGKMYQATLCVDPGGGHGYVPIARIWYEWQKWSFTYTELSPHHTTPTDFKYTYVWTPPLPTSVKGTWVPRFDWLIDQKTLDKFPSFKDKNGATAGGGWVLKPPSSDLSGSNSPFIWTLVSGAQAGAVSISLIANQADLPADQVDGRLPNEQWLQAMTWSGADMPAYAPILGNPPAKLADIQANPSAGVKPYSRAWSPGKEVKNQPVCRYTLSAVTNDPLPGSTFPRVKFLVVLD